MLRGWVRYCAIVNSVVLFQLPERFNKTYSFSIYLIQNFPANKSINKTNSEKLIFFVIIFAKILSAQQILYRKWYFIFQSIHVRFIHIWCIKGYRKRKRIGDSLLCFIIILIGVIFLFFLMEHKWNNVWDFHDFFCSIDSFMYVGYISNNFFIINKLTDACYYLSEEMLRPLILRRNFAVFAILSEEKNSIENWECEWIEIA